MSEEKQELELQQEEEREGRALSLPQPLLYGGATFAAAGIVDLAANLGPTGLVIGGIAALVAARHGPEIIDQLKELVNPFAASSHDEADQGERLALPAPRTDEQRPKRSFLDRALGRFPVGYEENNQEELKARPKEARRDDDHPFNRAERDPYDKNRHIGHLHLGMHLHPQADDILSKRIGMFGIPGSGKSNGLTVFVEELGKLLVLIDGKWVPVGVPFILADTEGEYYDLCTSRYLMRPYLANASNVTAESAYKFGQDVLELGLQVVLDLQSYEDDDQAAEVMIEIIRGLRAWAESRQNDQRATCMFLLDEAAIWLPQQRKESGLSDDVLTRLQQAFFGTVVRRGRKRGIGFLFATQRPADLDKRCISCDWLILFRQTYPNDIKVYAELGVPKDVPPALSKGEAIVIDPYGASTVHQFRRRHSPDNAQSPGVPALQKHAERWKAAAASPAQSAPSVPDRCEQDQAQQMKEPVPVNQDENQRKLTHLHRQALEHYQPGIGYRQLGELVGVKKDKAGDLIRDLKKWGFIADE